MAATIEGLPQLLERLSSIDKKVRKKVLARAVSAAGKIVLTTAKARVQVDTGLLRRALARKSKTYKSVAVQIVGPRTAFVMKKDRTTGQKVRTETGFGKKISRGGRKEVYARPSKYSHLVEKGTRRSRAFPFLRVSATGAAQQAMVATLAQGIEDAGNGR